MSLLQDIHADKLPQHVAVIMDGNGRWAKKQGLLRVRGHEKGTTAVRETVEACAQLNIPFLTLYAFSTENWNRPKMEVDLLMKLLVSSLKKELPTLQKNGIRLRTIGAIENLPASAQRELQGVMDATRDLSHMTLTLALSYGSREELLGVIRKLASNVASGGLNPEDINESMIQEHLYTSYMPDVDLMIRTSGEQRISNFMLWQSAYAELYFTEMLWPDFRKDDLFKAVLDYQSRERRFGKTSEQLK